MVKLPSRPARPAGGVMFPAASPLRWPAMFGDTPLPWPPILLDTPLPVPRMFGDTPLWALGGTIGVPWGWVEAAF